MKNGLIKEYYEGGNLKSEVNYINDKRDGIEYKYNENREIIEKLEFRNGELLDTKF